MVDVGTESTGIFTILLQKMAHLARIFVYILKSHFHCVISGKDKPVRSTGRTNNTINLIKVLDTRLITCDAIRLFEVVIFLQCKTQRIYEKRQTNVSLT